MISSITQKIDDKYELTTDQCDQLGLRSARTMGGRARVVRVRTPCSYLLAHGEGLIPMGITNPIEVREAKVIGLNQCHPLSKV